jgi:hypothetical protein
MDYGKPIVFDPRARQWNKHEGRPGHRPSVAEACR